MAGKGATSRGGASRMAWCRMKKRFIIVLTIGCRNAMVPITTTRVMIVAAQIWKQVTY